MTNRIQLEKLNTLGSLFSVPSNFNRITLPKKKYYLVLQTLRHWNILFVPNYFLSCNHYGQYQKIGDCYSWWLFKCLHSVWTLICLIALHIRRAFFRQVMFETLEKHSFTYLTVVKYLDVELKLAEEHGYFLWFLFLCG